MDPLSRTTVSTMKNSSDNNHAQRSLGSVPDPQAIENPVPKDQPLFPHQRVYYYSVSRREFVIAYVLKDHMAEGTVDLDCRPGAARSQVCLEKPDGKFEKKSISPKVPGALGEYGRDLVACAKRGDFAPLVGRETEMRLLLTVLARKTKSNPLIVGESGVGKTKLVQGLALRLALGSVPPQLKGCRLLEVDVGRLVAGASYKGELEMRIRELSDACTGSSERLILFIDDMHLALAAGRADGEGRGLNVADLLKPLVSGSWNGGIIGTTSHVEYKKSISKDAGFERAFQKVALKEPSIEETVEILSSLRPQFQNHHKVDIEIEALEKAASLTARYISGRCLPDKAIDCLDEACASKRMDLDEVDDGPGGSGRQGSANLTGEEIASIISAWTSIPLNKLTRTERDKLDGLDKLLAKRVLGQDSAIKEVTNAVMRARVKLNRPTGPMGSFLFCGPTGVGKTELCKALAEQMFDDERRLVRLDMSEFMEQHSVARLIGAPPGYLGHGDGGQLTEAVRKQPFSVVLLDEVEKACPRVFDVLLQTLDDGRLTDGQGVLVDFRNCIFIMTSNLGSAEQIEAMRVAPSREVGIRNSQQACQNAVEAHFRPEFLGRLDAVVTLQPLGREQLLAIVGLQLNELASRMEAEHQVSMEVQDGVCDVILDACHVPQYGARPLRSFIQRHIGTLLSHMLVKKTLYPKCKVIMSPEPNATQDNLAIPNLPIKLTVKNGRKPNVYPHSK